MHSSTTTQRFHRLREFTGFLLKQINFLQRVGQFKNNYFGGTLVLICSLYICFQVLFVRTFGMAATTSIARVQAQRQIAQQGDNPTASEPLFATSSITRVVIPVADISAPVLTARMLTPVSTNEQAWNIAHYAVGHHENTGFPGHGQNIVFSSYASSYGRIFATLDKAVPGSKITVYEGDTAHNYTVVSQQFVKIPHAEAYEQINSNTLTAPTNSEQVTIITCWPPHGSNQSSSYLVVIAKP